MKQLYIECRLNQWSDIFTLNQRFLDQFVFRGQANENWPLSTSLERLINSLFPNLVDKAMIPHHEKEMLKEFKWKYPLYSQNSPDSTNNIEWLTIMQHYGAATRLLDFSKSLFVAIRMAIANNESNSAVWAINKNILTYSISDSFLREKYEKTGKGGGMSMDKVYQLSNEKANCVITDKSFDRELEKELLLINPEQCNERLSIQQGLFVMPTNIMVPFSHSLTYYLSSPTPTKLHFDDLSGYNIREIALLKITIAKELNYSVLKYLRQMNITPETLFPGLEGLGKSLNYPRISFNRDGD